MTPRFLLAVVLAFLVGGALYLWLRPPAPTPPRMPAGAENSDSRSTASDQFLILAASWEPAFCETVRGKPECTGLGADRFDASHFSLHGLWPQGEYCGVPAALRQLDRDGSWNQLPPVELTPTLRRTLDEVMPGTRSRLERHEWIKHGTCYGENAERYYAAATALMATLNASAVRDLFAGNIGRRVSRDDIRAAFDAAFGDGAGQRVRVACDEDGDRRLISEITIGLWGVPGDTPDLGQLIRAARPTDGGCAGGIVDPAGAQ